MLSVVCLLPTTSFVSVSAEATPEFDKKSPKAKGIILSFRRWPGNAEQKRLIKKGSTKGLSKREEFPAFKVWVLEWSEWKSGKTAQQTCAQFSNLSFLKYCEPDYLLGPAQSANERLAPDVRLSEPLTEFSRTETGNVRTCNIIPSQLELQQGKLSDYWAQEMIGSDLAREELKRAPAVGKNLVAVFDFPNQNEHDAKVRNLISGEGRHAVLPAMGDKMTSFDGSLASNYLRHSQGLLNKVSRECQVSHSGSTQTGGGGQQPAPVSGGVAPVEAGQRPSTGSSTQTGGGGQQPAPVSGGVAPVEAGQRPPTGSSAQTGGGGQQPAPVSGGGASVEAGQRSPTGSSAQTGGGGKQPAPVSGGGASVEAGQRPPTGSSAQTGEGTVKQSSPNTNTQQHSSNNERTPAENARTRLYELRNQGRRQGGLEGNLRKEYEWCAKAIGEMSRWRGGVSDRLDKVVADQLAEAKAWVTRWQAFRNWFAQAKPSKERFARRMKIQSYDRRHRDPYNTAYSYDPNELYSNHIRIYNRFLSKMDGMLKEARKQIELSTDENGSPNYRKRIALVVKEGLGLVPHESWNTRNDGFMWFVDQETGKKYPYTLTWIHEPKVRSYYGIGKTWVIDKNLKNSNSFNWKENNFFSLDYLVVPRSGWRTSDKLTNVLREYVGGYKGPNVHYKSIKWHVDEFARSNPSPEPLP